MLAYCSYSKSSDSILKRFDSQIAVFFLSLSKMQLNDFRRLLHWSTSCHLNLLNSFRTN